jgi:hypothetical protein
LGELGELFQLGQGLVAEIELIHGRKGVGG